MKFHLNFPKPHPRRGRKSSQSSSGKRHKYDIGTVESWNDLRRIGAEGKKPKGAENVFKVEVEDVTLQEVQDWDYYIAQFNEQYRHQAKDEKEVDNNSISTIASTKSELMRSRLRRMIIFRKCFIFTCLLQWVVNFWGAHDWYINYLIRPIGFLNDLDSSLFSYYFTTKAKWIVFLLNTNGWFVASFGLICALCYRENPRVLRQYILRVPYILTIPLFQIFVSVRFVGTLSSQKLATIMDKKIPEYHNFDNNTGVQVNNMMSSDTSGKRLWDQLQKILQCCGVYSATDWDSVDTDLSDDLSYWPATCCPKPFVRRAWTKERPARDDCFYKINKQEHTDEYEWAYPQGCLNLAYEFFVKMGALVVGQMFCNFSVLCLALVFGYKYYTMARKVNELKFKYPWKQWFKEILFLNYCKCDSRKFCSCCKKSEKSRGKNKKHQSFASGHQSQASNDSAQRGELPSVVITEPVEGLQTDTDVEDPDTVTVLEHNPDNDKAFDADNIEAPSESEEDVDVMRVLFSKAEDDDSNNSLAIVDEK